MMNLKKTSISLVLAASLATVGCVYNHHDPKEVKEELNKAYALNDMDVPEEVLNELNPDNPLDSGIGAISENRISVSANNVPAVEFFGQIMMETGLSMVVHPDVEGTVSLNLENVTPNEIFDSLYKIYGYKVEKKGNIYYVFPAGVHTEIIPLDYLFIKRVSQTELSVANNSVTSNSNSSSSSSSNSNSSSSSSSNNSNSRSGGSSSSSNNSEYSGTSVVSSSTSDFWTELQANLTQILGKGEGRFVTVSPHASSITVRGMPDEIEAVRKYVKSIEGAVTRQVVIEAKLLEVTLSEDYQQGIDWSHVHSTLSLNPIQAWGGASATNTTFTQLGGGIALTFKEKGFQSVINLLQTQGDVSTLSSPRITTLNAQRAVMKIGNDRYFVTGVSTDSSTTSSSDTNLVSSNYDFSPFFSGVSLDVLPQISAEGKVMLHIHPAVIEVAEDVKKVKSQGKESEYPFATSEVRETDVIVEADSGDIIVIGGLMRHEKGNLESKIPLLGDIPWLGELFKNKTYYDRKTELVILLRPVVVGGETWKEEIKKSSDLLQKWYPEEK